MEVLPIPPTVLQRDIPSGTADSPSVDTSEYGALCGLFATEACDNNISIQVSPDDSTWFAVNGFSALTVSGAAFYPLDPNDFIATPFVRVHSAGNESADRTFHLAMRSI